MTARSIPAITIWQPWATLIAEGLKPHEFRSWPAPGSMVGRRIAIHAGARPTRKDEVRQLLLQLQSSSWRESGLAHEGSIELLERVLTAPRMLPLSSVICTAVLGTPVRGTALAVQIGVPLVNDSDRDAHTNWGWPLTDIRRVEPFAPARGAQGFWSWTPPDTGTERA